MDGKEKRVFGACAVQPRASMNNYTEWADIRFSLTQPRTAVMAATTEVLDPQVIMDGDIVLLHCPDTSGVVYSKPFG